LLGCKNVLSCQMKTLTVENLKDLLGIPGIYIIKINDKYSVNSMVNQLENGLL